jgi:RHH-type proline utilization regulon transcriptional repressor/proline dehydrogenase/delta 1-pyrroline-5-carboxylate dehydrogenase
VLRLPFRNEPVADFSREEARRRMEQALREVKGQLGAHYPLIVGGETVRTKEEIVSVNPSHCREVVGYCARADKGHAEKAIATAQKAFAAWRDTPARGRSDYLCRAAAIMRRRRFELAAWQVYECGKQWREADADVAEAIDFCEYYAREMVRLSESQHRDVPGETNEYFYEPRGVAVVIAPWNFPLAILCGMSAAALVTGNTVIMKPAEQSSVIGAKLMEVFQEAGVPAGVVSNLSGIGEEIGPVFVNHPAVALIAFTGSRGVGLWINRQAAEMPTGQDHVKRVIAEMGGKNAIIIDDDADLDEAVHGVAHSAFGYQGQKCSACSRVIVLESIYDLFLNRLIEATRSLKIAPAEDPGSSIGAVIDAEARQRILGAIEKGKQEARLAFAGDLGPLVDEGYYVAPHIFADVAPTGSLAQEEIFGPVLAVMKAHDLNEALAIANGTAYALTGGLYSRSPQHIARVRREFRVGNLYLNRKITGALVDRQPFGGFKLSGIGSKAGGPDYLLQFVLPRTITENTMRRGFAPRAEGE